MEAAVHYEYGNESVLQVKTIPIPNFSQNEILVKVKAATVNRTDCAYLTGKPAIMHLVAGFKKPRNPITGSDFAGVIESVGEAVTKFKPGDRVVGLDTDQLSSHAEFIVIHQDAGITQIADTLSFSEAVAAMEGAHYAYNFIKYIQDIKGKRILVNGATGAIGSAALQFLKYHGATVTAVCRHEHDELIHKIGGDEVIHYDKEDFTKANQSYDAIFDTVGKSTFGQCKGILNPNGIYISSELGPKLQNPLLSLLTHFGTGQKVKFPIPTDVKKSIRYIMERLADDSFKPMIDREYPFEEIREAYKYVLGGQKVGNVVLNFED